MLAGDSGAACGTSPHSTMTMTSQRAVEGDFYLQATEAFETQQKTILRSLSIAVQLVAGSNTNTPAVSTVGEKKYCPTISIWVKTIKGKLII